jgi:hypothetical protein
LPVEHNFFLWPDSVEVTISTSSLTPTGTVTSGSFIITAVSSTAGVGLGMAVSGTAIPPGAIVTSFSSTTITISKAATGSNTAETITLAGNIGPQPDGATNTNAYYVQVIYEWTDNQGNAHRSAPSIPVSITTTGTTKTGTYIFTYNIPTLRLTYKTANPVKIRVFRWSVQNQVYYEVTSITQPTLNSTTVDSVTVIDALNDSSIVGNNIIYTTGGVAEDIGAPACNVMTLFDDRLWLLDAENQNLLWFSKQVIQSTPVEMSDVFTYYIAPSTGAQGSTGNISALAPMDDKIIIFKANAIYYVNGTGPDNTGANNNYSQPIFVTATVGCSNQNSIVFTPNGLMFQSDKGIWLLGRDLSTSYIGSPVEDFTQYDPATATQPIVQSAVNVPGTNQVRFTMSTGITLMYDYYFRQWGTFSGVPAISSTLYQGFHTYINAIGQVFQETPGRYFDGANPVLMSFTTSWFNLAGLQGYQRVIWGFLLGQYLTPHKLRVGISYDYNSAVQQQIMISPDNNSPPFGVSTPFGNQTPFGGPSDIEQWQLNFQNQTCTAFQLTLQEFFDPTIGPSAGAGLTLSGLDLVYGAKKGFPRKLPASRKTG